MVSARATSPPSSIVSRRIVFDRKRAAKLFRNLPELTTPRLLLRKFKRADARDVFAYASDPEVTRYTPWEHHRDLKVTRQFVDHPEGLSAGPSRSVGSRAAPDGQAHRRDRPEELGAAACPRRS